MHVCVCVVQENDTRAEVGETSTSQEGVKFGELTHYRKNISLFRNFFWEFAYVRKSLGHAKSGAIFSSTFRATGKMPSLFFTLDKEYEGEKIPQSRMW